MRTVRKNGKTVTLSDNVIFVNGRAHVFPSPGLARHQFNRVLRYRATH